MNNRETPGDPEQPDQETNQEEPSKLVSIDFGKAVQFVAGSIAGKEGLPGPEASHYSVADKQAEGFSEDEIELYAQVQKLKDFVGGRIVHEFYDLLSEYRSEALKSIEDTTTKAELDRRVERAKKSLSFGSGAHIERESTLNAIRYSAIKYGQDVALRIKKHFEDLKRGLLFPEDAEQRELVESTVDYLVGRYYEATVEAAKQIYLTKISDNIYDEEK